MWKKWEFQAFQLYLLVQLCVKSCNSVIHLPCHLIESVNLSNSANHNNESITHDGHVYYDSNLQDNSNRTVEEHLRGCICGFETPKPCIPFCCPENFVKIENSSDCMPLNREVIMNSSNTENYGIIRGRDCDAYELKSVKKIGSIIYLDVGKTSKVLNHDDFCLDKVLKNNDSVSISVKLCVIKEKEETSNILLPCSFYESINITDGLKHDNGSISHKGHLFHNGSYGHLDYVFLHDNSNQSVENHLRGCICGLKTSKPCVPFCCPENYLRNENSSDCTYHNHELIVQSTNKENYEDIYVKNHYQAIHKSKCESIELDSEENDEWVLLQNGSIHYVDADQTSRLLSSNDYCFNKVLKNDGNISIVVNWCFENDPESSHNETDDPRHDTYPFFMVLSIIFLVPTLFIYCVIPQLRNLHGKSLMCYMLALIVMYTFLSIIKKYTVEIENTKYCVIFGYITYSSMLVAFFFLNVISIDIYSTFNMTRNGSLRQRYKHKLFYVYSAYGFGVPMLIVVFVVFMDNLKSVPQEYKPGFGVQTCLMSTDRWLSFFYLYLIISIIMIINIVLFSITAYRIYAIKKAAVKNQNSRRHSHTNLEREKWEKIPFFLFLRLFIVMGASWIMEVVSWSVDGHIPDYISYPTDFINATQGVFIFIFFICKRSVWKLIQNKWYNTQFTSQPRSTFSSDTKISMSRMGSVRYTRNNSILSSK